MSSLPLQVTVAFNIQCQKLHISCIRGAALTLMNISLPHDPSLQNKSKKGKEVTVYIPNEHQTES